MEKNEEVPGLPGGNPRGEWFHGDKGRVAQTQRAKDLAECHEPGLIKTKKQRRTGKGDNTKSHEGSWGGGARNKRGGERFSEKAELKSFEGFFRVAPRDQRGN